MSGLPIQSPRQSVFGDSCAVLADIMRDATKFLVSTAEVVPGLPAALGVGAGDANVGKLKADPDTADVFYGVFINLPINSFLGRTSLGEMEAKKATVLQQGRLLARDAVFQTSTGTQDTIKPFLGTVPTTGDVGTLLDAVEVAPGADNPFTTTILKWQLHTAAGNGFTKCAMLTGVSDDSTEFEINILPGAFVYGAIV